MAAKLSEAGITLEGVLIIERSATLGHLLERTLTAGKLKFDRTMNSYEDGLIELRRRIAAEKPPRLIILGAPPSTLPAFAKFLKFLVSVSAKDIPVLIIAHERTEELNAFCQNRKLSHQVQWSGFGRIPAVAQALLKQSLDANQSDKAIAEEAEENTGVRVLFVDDSQSVRYAYGQLLQKNGFAVDTAATKAEALKQVADNHYDLMVIDYFLPDGNGEELCHAVKSDPRTAGVTCCIITGTYKESVIKACLEAGAVECVFKNEAKELFMARMKSLARTIETQKSVEAERQRLDGILGSVGEGVYGVDETGKITFINPVGLRMLGYDTDEPLLGQPAQSVIHPSQEGGPDQQLKRAYLEGTALNGHELVLKKHDESSLAAECTVFPLSIQDERQGSVIVFRDITQRKSADQLHWEVFHDPLTKLGNRRLFSQKLEEYMAAIESGKDNYAALLYIDLDRFTHIVEAAGPGQADAVLADVARKLLSRLRTNDVLCRIEGDRFAMLLQQTDLSNVYTIADGFREQLHECTYEIQDESRRVTGCVGVVVLSSSTPSAEYAMEHARVACQLAKKKGRDQTHIYVAEEDSRIRRKLESGWTERFREALRENRFTLFLQPISAVAELELDRMQADATDNWRRGLIAPEKKHNYLFEVLLRMNSGDGQWVSPGVFVPLAERVNMIQEIDIWVIGRLIKTLTTQRSEDAKLVFSVNLSNVTLQDIESLNRIHDIVKSAQLPKDCLVFEITETSEMGNVHLVRRFIQTMKKMGVRFALDDFGTGFSSFSHLKNLPVDFIKIDGQFVESMSTSKVDRTMVRSIAEMARSLQLKTIAEHVNSSETFAALKASAIHYAQGHFLGEPEPLDKLDFSFLKRRKS